MNIRNYSVAIINSKQLLYLIMSKQLLHVLIPLLLRIHY